MNRHDPEPGEWETFREERRRRRSDMDNLFTFLLIGILLGTAIGLGIVHYLTR